MRNEIHTYKPDDVVVALGSHMPSGFAADNFIAIAALGDGVTDEAGADGEVVVNVSTDPRYEVKMVFLYGSSTNDWLLNKYNAFRENPGSGFFSVMINDLGDNPQFTASQAWITKQPQITYGAKGANQEWTIHCVGKLG